MGYRDADDSKGMGSCICYELSVHGKSVVTWGVTAPREWKRFKTSGAVACDRTCVACGVS